MQCSDLCAFLVFTALCKSSNIFIYHHYSLQDVLHASALGPSAPLHCIQVQSFSASLTLRFHSLKTHLAIALLRTLFNNLNIFSNLGHSQEDSHQSPSLATQEYSLFLHRCVPAGWPGTLDLLPGYARSDSLLRPPDRRHATSGVKVRPTAGDGHQLILVLSLNGWCHLPPSSKVSMLYFPDLVTDLSVADASARSRDHCISGLAAGQRAASASQPLVIYNKKNGIPEGSEQWSCLDTCRSPPYTITILWGIIHPVGLPFGVQVLAIYPSGQFQFLLSFYISFTIMGTVPPHFQKNVSQAHVCYFSGIWLSLLLPVIRPSLYYGWDFLLSQNNIFGTVWEFHIFIDDPL